MVNVEEFSTLISGQPVKYVHAHNCLVSLDDRNCLVTKPEDRIGIILFA